MVGERGGRRERGAPWDEPPQDVGRSMSGCADRRVATDGGSRLERDQRGGEADERGEDPRAASGTGTVEWAGIDLMRGHGLPLMVRSDDRGKWLQPCSGL